MGKKMRNFKSMTDQNCILLWPFFIESANLTLSIFYCLVYLTMPNLRVFPSTPVNPFKSRMNILNCEGRGASWFENIAISYYNHLVFILICWCHFYSVYSSENKRRRNLRCFQRPNAAHQNDRPPLEWTWPLAITSSSSSSALSV